MSSQILQDRATGNSTKCLAEVQVNNTHNLSLSTKHLVVQGDQVSQAGPTIHKPILTEPHHLVVPCDYIHDYMLHNLLWHQG